MATSWNHIVGVELQRYSKTLIYIWTYFYHVTKSVEKINYDVPLTSWTKLKNHKVRMSKYRHTFKQNLRQPIGITKILEYSFVSSSKRVAFKTSGLKIWKLCLNILNVPMFKTSGCICTKVSLRNSNNL